MTSCCNLITNGLKKVAAFAGGFALGEVYYHYLLKQIPFPGSIGRILSLVISVSLAAFATFLFCTALLFSANKCRQMFTGLGNAVSTQLRCISVLNFPMYCEKPGRGVLKAVILTYIVTGPIKNMGLNAKEVVRVFACSTQLSYNLSRERYALVLVPARNAALGVATEVEQVKDAFRSIEKVIEPLQQEIEDTNETDRIRLENNLIDDFFRHKRRLEDIDMKLQSTINNSCTHYALLYQRKLQYRCEDQLSRASAVCIQEFSKAYSIHCKLMPKYAEHLILSPLKHRDMCDLIGDLKQNFSATKDICEPPIQPGLGRGFEVLKYVKTEFVDNSKNIHLQYRISYERELLDIKDAKEIAARVQHAFEEKTIVMHHVLTVMNICVALLFLRIFNAARIYHDCYLTDIEFDNVYVTDYFKRLDARRWKRQSYHLLPLKKMETNKYVDVYSTSFMESQRSHLVMQILKVLLEVVTATTFLMLDRLFFEALEVVRQHTEAEVLQHGTRDFDIQVEGTGILATMLHKFFDGLNTPGLSHRVSNSACLPRPRQMPCVYFLKIYGGYSWIVLLLFANPYTLRSNRFICSYFYPQREKQRILHLYNDMLKQRMKMQKTVRRKAKQTARAHYLSGDVLSLHALRTKFPSLLGWLRVLPAARVRCLICGVVEPRRQAQSVIRDVWHTCVTASCPFMYCDECWHEVGAHCLACEPSPADLSDNDSLSDDEPLKY